MNFDRYAESFREKAELESRDEEYISRCLQYAQNLNEHNALIIYNTEHFSKMVGWNCEFLRKITNSPRLFYRYYKIPKRSGGFRDIAEPLPALKEIQTFILKNILENFECSACSKAFRKKVSLKDNAKFHRGQKYILKIDLRNYFGSLDERRVWNFFRQLGYTTEVTALLTRLCVLDHALPQGAPTSPCLSNLLTVALDNELFAYCNMRKLRYTRYADDITISGTFRADDIMQDIFRIIRRHDLKINYEKTALVGQNRRQTVTGVVVNNKLQVPRPYRRQIRQEMYYIRKYGLEDHLEKTNIKLSPEVYLYNLLGRISFCLQINRNDAELREYKKELRKILRELLREFQKK